MNDAFDLFPVTMCMRIEAAAYEQEICISPNRMAHWPSRLIIRLWSVELRQSKDFIALFISTSYKCTYMINQYNR